MNKKHWLIAGLSLAMAASIGIGISACGGDKDPETPPTPEHTHAYTEWEHDDDQHWKVCPDDGELDPAGKSDHNFVDGVCTDCKVSLADAYSIWLGPAAGKTLASYPDLQELGHQRTTVYPDGTSEIFIVDTEEDAAKTNPKLTLEPSSNIFSVIVYAEPDNYVSFSRFSKEGDPNFHLHFHLMREISSVYFSEAGVYKISWEFGAAKATRTKIEGHEHTYTDDTDEACDVCHFMRHVHKYTQQLFDADQHWSVCPDDGTLSPEGKVNHTFDPETGTCECGAQTKEVCKHEHVTFDYTPDTLPEAAAEGGTLQSICDSCKSPVEVTYNMGMEPPTRTNLKTVPALEGDENAFVRFPAGTVDFYFKFKLDKAGTYEISLQYFSLSSKLAAAIERAINMGFSSVDIGRDPETFVLNTSSFWSSGKFPEEHAFHSLAEGCTVDNDALRITITIGEEDVAEGALYLFFSYHVIPWWSEADAPYGIFITNDYTAPAATSSVAPQEVAILPGKND